MSETDTLPDEVRGWIGKKRYEQEGDFDVERGYVFTTCASVENGNPLFWDEKAASEITGGFIAPEVAMLSRIAVPSRLRAATAASIAESAASPTALGVWMVTTGSSSTR